VAAEEVADHTAGEAVGHTAGEAAGHIVEEVVDRTVGVATKEVAGHTVGEADHRPKAVAVQGQEGSIVEEEADRMLEEVVVRTWEEEQSRVEGRTWEEPGPWASVQAYRTSWLRTAKQRHCTSEVGRAGWGSHLRTTCWTSELGRTSFPCS